MKKSLCPLLLLLIVACNAPAPETKTDDNVTIIFDTIASADPASDTLAETDNNQVVHNESQVSDHEEDTLHMIGDFYGDYEPDSAFLVIVEDKIAKKRKQTADSTYEDEEELSPYYELHFHGKGAPKFRPIGRADVSISNEGDLDGDGKEDVSVIRLKPPGEESWNEIYACKKGKWVLIQKLEYVCASSSVSHTQNSTSSLNRSSSFGSSSFRNSRRSSMFSRMRSRRR